jgi:hypothetical protein
LQKHFGAPIGFRGRLIGGVDWGHGYDAARITYALVDSAMG